MAKYSFVYIETITLSQKLQQFIWYSYFVRSQTTVDSWLDFRYSRQISPLFGATRLSLGFNQLPTQCVQTNSDFLRGMKLTTHLHLVLVYILMAQCSIRHRDNHAITTYLT
jgi:hypothetical protein